MCPVEIRPGCGLVVAIKQTTLLLPADGADGCTPVCIIHNCGWVIVVSERAQQQQSSGGGGQKGLACGLAVETGQQFV